ncbi:MAG TPA: hypothetical protein VFI44_02790 [Ornithinibacter sp.]|nr:hypothetical protein [Ornithinibacter sp.]
MNRTASRRIAPVLVALALVVTGCGGESDDETPSPAQSANAELCDGYTALQKAVDDLKATPLDTTGTPEEVQAQVAVLQEKAATVKADLNRISALSDGPVAAAVGEMNQKADALRESLTQAKADAQEEMGPKITAAQQELDAAYAEVTTTLDEACPSS